MKTRVVPHSLLKRIFFDIFLNSSERKDLKTMLPDYKRNMSRKLISAELSDEARITSRSRFTFFLVLAKENGSNNRKKLTLDSTFGNFLRFVSRLTMPWNRVVTYRAPAFKPDMSSMLLVVFFLTLARTSRKIDKCPRETICRLFESSNPLVGSAFLISISKNARKKAKIIARVFILESCTWKTYKPLRCVAAICDIVQKPCDVIDQYAVDPKPLKPLSGTLFVASKFNS